MALKITDKNIRFVLEGIGIDGINKEYIEIVRKSIDIKEYELDLEDCDTKAEKDEMIREEILSRLGEKIEGDRLYL